MIRLIRLFLHPQQDDPHAVTPQQIDLRAHRRCHHHHHHPQQHKRHLNRQAHIRPRKPKKVMGVGGH